MGPDSRCHATKGGRGPMVALGRRMYGAGTDPREIFAREVMQSAAQEDGAVREAVQTAMEEGVNKCRGNCAKCGVRADGSVTVSFCSGCRSVAYCSKECQKADWKAHKAACRQIRQAKEQIALNKGNPSTKTLGGGETEAEAGAASFCAGRTRARV
eukprot:3914677-Rhodomonas_salina.1